MLRKNDLEKQKAFTKYIDNNWYDSEGDYVICFEGNRAVLRAHCEVNGILDEIKELHSLEDLLDTIEILNIVQPD